MENSIFINKVFESGQRYICYFDESMISFLAVLEKKKNVFFGGDWSGCYIPEELLPQKWFFVSAVNIDIMSQLKKQFRIKEDWPCWRFIAPDDFGKGPWDELERLVPKDAPFIARHWELQDAPVKYLRERIKKFESACARVRGKPVAWGGLHFELPGVAEMGFAHTLKRYRRKGYASLVTKAVVNRVAAHGSIAYCHVFKTNRESIALCKKLGFTKAGEYTWAVVLRKKK